MNTIYTATDKIDLESALRSWSITASLEKGLADTRNPDGAWAKQARGLLERDKVWQAVRPKLQAMVDEHQEQLQKDHRG